MPHLRRFGGQACRALYLAGEPHLLVRKPSVQFRQDILLTVQLALSTGQRVLRAAQVVDKG